MRRKRLPRYTCKHIKRDGKVCGHTWIPREDNVPYVCPLCRSPKWNVPVPQNGQEAVQKKKVKT
jgi:hypothetical protein